MLTVSTSDVVTVIVLSFFAVAVLVALYHKLLYITLDEDIAYIIGIRV